jgi:hypothetical protein
MFLSPEYILLRKRINSRFCVVFRQPFECFELFSFDDLFAAHSNMSLRTR